MTLHGLGQLVCLYFNLLSDCPPFPFLQRSEATLGCRGTFATPKSIEEWWLGVAPGTGRSSAASLVAAGRVPEALCDGAAVITAKGAGQEGQE